MWLQFLKVVKPLSQVHRGKVHDLIRGVPELELAHKREHLTSEHVRPPVLDYELREGIQCDVDREHKCEVESCLPWVPVKLHGLDQDEDTRLPHYVYELEETDSRRGVIFLDPRDLIDRGILEHLALNESEESCD